MKRVLRWVVGVVLCLLLLAVGLALFRDRIFKAVAENRIQKQIGLKARIGSLRTGLGSGAIAVREFRIYNPPDFGGSVFLDVPELYVELDPQGSTAGKLRFKTLRFHLAELNLVRDRDGRLNVESMQSSMTPSPARTNATARPAGKGFEFGGIDKLHLTLGTVNYTDLEQPKNSHQFVLGIDNEVVEHIQSEQELETWMKAFLIRLAVQEYMKLHAERGRSKNKGLDSFWKWLQE